MGSALPPPVLNSPTREWGQELQGVELCSPCPPQQIRGDTSLAPMLCSMSAG